MNSMATRPSTTLCAPAAIADLRWYRAVVRLRTIRSVPGKTPPAFLAMQAIVKRVSTMFAAESNGTTNPSLIFHLINKRFSYKARQEDLLDLSLLFFNADSAGISRWLEHLQHYLTDAVHQTNFQLVDTLDFCERSYANLKTELLHVESSGELCLDFLMPVPFKPAKERDRTYIDTEQFVKLFDLRFSKLFGKEIRYTSCEDNFSILSNYWKYTEIPHKSLSQPGTTQYIKGCFGPLYIKGLFKDFLPYLILGSELHAGSKLSYGQGYYILRQPSPPYFSRFFPNKKALMTVIEEVRERYDSALEKPEQAEHRITNDEQFAEDLLFQLTHDQYVPAPSTAFIIQKKDGGERMLEQLSIRDLIVHQYLLKTIADPLDRLFEESSIGYRKGFSRQRAAQMVQQALAEGYQYVMESDISDFFPSVDLHQLSRLIDASIPENDTLIKQLLNKCIRTGYILNGTFHERTRGLAQGSPLSPILANLYLDSFDEHLASLDVKVIRYADDLIILTRTREEAERAFTEAESFLGGLGLRLKREKTAIKPIAEGFQFLGMTFTRTETQVTPEEELKRFKKPLYITEPYLFLSLNGEAITVLKNGTPLETIPLRRLSEVIVMEKVAFSSGLLKQCVEQNIPLTITLGSGYYITTIKPDSKQYYNLAYEHANKFYQMSDTEVLSIAKEFAAIKLQNAMSLFRQKYTAGNNRLINQLEDAVRRIYQAADIHTVRGIEGASARNVYQGLNTLIDDPAFHLRKRDRTKPDRINSLLNFGYYLLYSRINATIRAVGLNPYLGFLHAAEDSYESLVADIQELFRARVDRFLIRLLNLKIITKNDFTETERGTYLTPEGKRKFLHHFEVDITRPSGKEQMSLLDWLYYQVIVFKKWVRQQGSLTFYRWEV
jgi:group II intron reverse transcriptase/maturase/CRISPR-associated endonuclease Cas1